MIINDAKAEDIPALSQLLDELFSIEQDFKPDSARQIRGLHMLLADTARSAIKVARSDGQIVGMVSVQLVISTAEGAPSAWVEDMVVRDGWRGSGVGRALLDALMEWTASKGATRAQLLVDIDNEPAIGYYDHLGWQSTKLVARRIHLCAATVR